MVDAVELDRLRRIEAAMVAVGNTMQQVAKLQRELFQMIAALAAALEDWRVEAEGAVSDA